MDSVVCMYVIIHLDVDNNNNQIKGSNKGAKEGLKVVDMERIQVRNGKGGYNYNFKIEQNGIW